MSRILRSLVCLLLICCMLVNLSPLNAQASAVGATAAITAASTVLSPAGLVVGATFVALGLAAAANPEGFQNMVDAGVSALESAGTWVKDGVVELLRTEDADGNASYYVDSGLVQDINSWVYSSGSVSSANAEMFTSGTAVHDTKSVVLTSQNPAFVFLFYNHSTGVYSGHCLSTVSGNYIYGSANGSQVFSTSTQISSSGFYWSYFLSEGVSPSDYSYPVISGYASKSVGSWRFYDEIAKYVSFTPNTSLDVTLGELPTSNTDLTDGTSARQWSEEYTDRGLKVYGGGSGNNNNDGKWFWKVIIPTTAATLYAMSQADQWSGETPKEFDDYSSFEEFEIVSRPEVEFGQGLELAPVTSPDPGTGTNPGTGTDPDPGTNPGTNPNPGTDPDPGTGTDPTPDSGSSGAPSKDMEFFALDLKEFFPFCIPFDLYDFFTCLNADPVAPVIEWVIPLPGGDTYPLELDLSTFDPVAQLLRRLQLLLFCVGLAFKTRDLIKG